jgi:hypothetical protein
VRNCGLRTGELRNGELRRRCAVSDRRSPTPFATDVSTRCLPWNSALPQRLNTFFIPF